MRVLVATRTTQGAKKSDFSFTTDGEMVMFGFECRNACYCGCARSLTGMQSRKGTTTFKVAEHKLTFNQFKQLIKASLETAWKIKFPAKDIDARAYQLKQIASRFEIGQVLELSDGFVEARI